MRQRLFCELSPFTYKISVFKCRIVRRIKDFFAVKSFAKTKQSELLPIIVYKHESLIRRKLGNSDVRLQNNKAINLSIAVPKVNGILIKPGETFSFWKLVGNTTAKKGYKEGLTISNSKITANIGGGMCQFTNLIHWMVLHTPLKIVERHHHDGFDLFPDYNRKVPFGTGTSIMYNYLDYRFINESDVTFQVIVYVTDTHLCGELRANKELGLKYNIVTENEQFVRKGNEVYRTGRVYRTCIDKHSGRVMINELLQENNAKVMYNTSELEINENIS